MEQKQLNYFRKKLEDMNRELLAEAEKTIHEMTGQADSYPDPTDRASAESDRSFELRIRDRERKLLTKIKGAIDRIEEGTYGVCDSCDDDISIKRLEARPVTILCITCKTRQEQQEESKT